ncbi:DUF3108 domain-containing protein [Halorhodospira halophila]|uniref:DUF3108 domain-containing protein n=1 Tax=Halorhodospira halophila TaxID=1053 RepID=UPI001911448F|nr:DUF3108 domain-containing protein [Halorhodospira halophila]MBK5943025.1 hypothetical protein [Halorhodospira halophila]
MRDPSSLIPAPRRVAAWLLLGLLAGTAALAAPAALAEAERIPEFRAEYEVKYGRLTLGTSRLELEYLGDDRYRYEMFVRPRGLARAVLGTNLTDISEGRVLEDGTLRPERFIHKREGRDERHEEITFDHDAGQVTFEDGERIDLEEGAVDRLLPQLLIMRDLSATFDRVLTYRIADDAEISDYSFERKGRERVSVAAGSYRAERIQRVRDGDSSRESNAWVYRRMHNLPVKIEHADSGRTFVMELTDVSGPIRDD